MSPIDPTRSPSLLDLISGAGTADQAKPPRPSTPSAPTNGQGIVDRRDEGGTPYPKDLPNPLGKRDGCF